MASDVEIITPKGEVILAQNTHLNDNIQHDYESARGNLHSLLVQGQEALMSALDVAKQSENPRAFEVVGNLMTQLADVNSKLLDLSEKRQKLADKAAVPAPGNQVTNNNAFFVGSTADLNKMLTGMTGHE